MGYRVNNGLARTVRSRWSDHTRPITRPQFYMGSCWCTIGFTSIVGLGDMYKAWNKYSHHKCTNHRQEIVIEPSYIATSVYLCFLIICLCFPTILQNCFAVIVFFVFFFLLWHLQVLAFVSNWSFRPRPKRTPTYVNLYYIITIPPCLDPRRRSTQIDLWREWVVYHYGGMCQALSTWPCRLLLHTYIWHITKPFIKPPPDALGGCQTAWIIQILYPARYFCVVKR